jgi:translocation and assembly module TamB
MASVSQRRTRRQGSFESAKVRAYRTPKRRWPKRIVIGLTLLVILVMLLPTIIAKTPLRDVPLRLALRNMHGTVQAGGASLSWFAPLEYSDLEIRNSRGELLVSLAKVQSERSLYGLLSNLNDLGTFRIERPQVNVALRPDGSNLEDLFANEKNPFPKPEPAPVLEQTKASQQLPIVTAEIVDGIVNILDTASGQKWSIDKFNLHVRTSPNSMLPAELMASAEVPIEGRTAQVAVTSAPSPNGGWDHIDAKIDSLPLAMFRGLADRVAPGLQLNGTLSTNLRLEGIGNVLAPAVSQGTKEAEAPPIQVSGTVGLDNVVASG